MTGRSRRVLGVPAVYPVPQLAVINGPPGVGKSTVGRLVAGSARNGVCIHGDDLKNFVVARNLQTVSTGLSYVGAAALADVFFDGGYDLVVVDFIFSRAEHVERLRDALRSRAAIAVFMLWAPLEIVQARETHRRGRERLGERVVQTWTDLASSRGELGVVIDATPTPVEIAAAIQRRLNSEQTY